MQYEEALRKVRHLLNLADQTRGATPEEAATAAAKAQAIMDKFGININDADFDFNTAKADAEPIRDFGYEDPLEPSTGYGDMVESWSVKLASVLSQHNQCITRFRRNPEDRTSQIRIIGRPSDVTLVRYLYGFFKLQILQLKKEHCAGNSSAYKGQFCFGCIDTLAEKLTKQRAEAIAQQKQESSGDSKALVRIDNAVARIRKRSAEVAAWFAAHNTMRSGKTGFRGSSTELGGRVAGRAAGQSIRLTGARAAVGSG